MTNTTKTAILAILLIVTAALSGCIGDAAKEDATLEHMVQLEAILTNPEISEEEKIAAYTSTHEAITGEKYELNSDVTLEEIEYKIVGLAVRQGNTDIIEGISELIVTINGGEDYGTLTEIEVFVNDISLGTYPPEYQTDYKVPCDIIGTWEVRIDGTFTDGTTQILIETSGFSLQEMKDTHNAGALGERYIEVSDDQMSREDAKALCDELGIVWAAD